jgi:hypothetical protein
MPIILGALTPHAGQVRWCGHRGRTGYPNASDTLPRITDKRFLRRFARLADRRPREGRRGLATAAIVLLELLRILDVPIQPSGIAAAGAAGGLIRMGSVGWVAEVSLRRIGQGGVPVLERVIGATGLNPFRS